MNPYSKPILQAISVLNGKVAPGCTAPLEVRLARSHQYVQAGNGPEDNRQLFFAGAPAASTTEDVRGVFAAFGKIYDINLFRERRTQASKGCGFVTFVERGDAERCREALDSKLCPELSGAKLSIKWADPDLPVSHASYI